MTPEKAREEGRRIGRAQAIDRINEIMRFSYWYHGCKCARCDATAI